MTNRMVRLVLPILIAVIVPLIFPNVTHADGFSWSLAKPIIASSTKISSNVTSSWCHGYFQSKNISGVIGQKNVCITGGDNVKFGSYFDNNQFTFVVGISYDSQMYKINSPCFEYDDCIYLPDTDALVTRQHLVNNYVRSLVVYKNFISRLTRKTNGFSFWYEFNSLNPNYIFKSGATNDYPNGYAWPINAMSASDNGKWLVVEFRERGVGLLNIDTLKMKRISSYGLKYGFGYDPIIEFAISNDGKNVAKMGRNVDLSVISVDDECGDYPTDNDMANVTSIANICHVTQFDPNEIITRLVTTNHPKFSSDGGQLNFYAGSAVVDSREILMQVSGYAGQKLDYLAMGDSFQSGEGETDDRNYFDGTNNIFEKCHVSARSYPFLIAGLMNINLSKTRNVACSGATMADIYGNNENYLGQDDRLGIDGVNFSQIDRITAQTEAVYSFIQGRVRQIEFAKRYQPRTITIGIGGNDAGFMKKLQSCIGLGTCDSAGTAQGREQVAEEIQSLFEKLVKTYQEVHQASPSSKIYVIGYPKIIDENRSCGVTLDRLLSQEEKIFMNEGVKYLNSVVASASRSAGVKYIDIYDAYGDGVLCGKSDNKSMNGIRIGDDTPIIDSADWYTPIGQESFHPTPLGHENNTRAIISSVGNILDYNYCSDEVVICPDGSIVAPEPSDYWVSGYKHNYPKQRITNFIVGNKIDSVKKNIELSKNSFMPGSIAKIEVTSTPVNLGDFGVFGDGSLSASVELPKDIENGFHTIHIYGKSYSGEDIELYQIFEYKKIEEPINTNATKQIILASTTQQSLIVNSDMTKNNDEPWFTNIGELTIQRKISIIKSNQIIDNNYDDRRCLIMILFIVFGVVFAILVKLTLARLI